MDSYSARALTATLVILASAAVIVHAWPTAGAEETSSASRTQKRKSRVSKNADKGPQYVTGLVNIGNTCFMNSVLQALASLPSLQTYLRGRKELGHGSDSITLALFETVELLTALHRRPTSKRPVKMVNTVKAKAAQVLTSQQQDMYLGMSIIRQDAQELFQILSSQLSEEREKVDHPTTSSLLDRMAVSEILNPPLNRRQSASSVMSASLSSLSLSSSASTIKRSKSVSGNTTRSSPPSSPLESAQEDKEDNPNVFMTASLIMDKTEQEKYNRAKSPFMGLLASRVSCVDCGYTAAIRHSTFDNLSLTVPPQLLCTLENCLDAFIHLDTISDFNCRKCTLLSSSRELGKKIEQLQNPSAPAPTLDTDADAEDDDTTVTSVSKPDNNALRILISQLEETKAKIDECLATNIEMDLSPIELTQVRSKKTTKHSMIAKPPQALCLHLNRSMFMPSGQLDKNPCKVVFQPVLDFTPFTTSGYLNTVATKSMSRRGSLSLAETVASASSSDAGPTLSKSLSKPSWAYPAMPIEHGTTSSKNGDLNGNDPTEQQDDRILYRLRAVVVHLGSHNSGHFVTYRRIPSVSLPLGQTSMVDESKSKWWRISDEDVQIVAWDTVKNTEAYMLFYEKETSTSQ
ncbi:hypothetical protein BG000_008604 [Podila horticola]|nr:hypothetical protein BG000_008604 [Podila horticola]